MKKALKILLIEDDTIEKMKFERVVGGLRQNHNVTTSNNGEAALFLLKSQELIPDLIILDLNMPKISGIEFLKILKTDDRLKFVPAIIVSTSNNYKDILECYTIGIAGYIVKPLKYEDYVTKIELLLAYWCINEFVSL